MPLRHKVLDAIPKQYITRAARDLNMLKRNTIVCDEEEIPFIPDRAIHDIKIGGKIAIDIFLEKEGKNITPLERSLLEGWKTSHWSAYEVKRVIPQVRLEIENIFTGDVIPLKDISFSLTARTGLIIATRIVKNDRFYHTGGANVVFTYDKKEELKTYFEKRLEKYKKIRRLSYVEFFKEKGYLFYLLGKAKGIIPLTSDALHRV